MTLEDRLNFLDGDLPSLINRVNALREGFTTVRTLEALIAFTLSVVLVGFRVVAVGTSHHASPDSSDADDESHVSLVHDPHELVCHVPLGFGKELNAEVLQPFLRQRLRDVSSISKHLAKSATEQIRNGLTVIDIPQRDGHIQQLPNFV